MLITGDEVAFQCHSCRCAGCRAVASYTYAGYRLSSFGPLCGCDGSGNETNTVGHSYVVTELGSQISVWFDKQVLLYEDEHDESPGVTVGRRSSPVTLTIGADGGAVGGTLTVSPKNFQRLFRSAGGVLPVSPIHLPPGSNITYSVTYEALDHSRDENDISVNVQLVEGGSGNARLDCTAVMTSVELELTAAKKAPENPCPHRHEFGVREKVVAKQNPSMPSVEWQAEDWTALSSNPAELVCPLVATNRGGSVRALCRDAVYTFDVSVFNPTGVFSRAGEATWNFRSRVPGAEIPVGAPGTGMRVPVYVGPMDVSFEGIAIAELECHTGSHSGYFSNAYFENVWSHSGWCGAGEYYPVKPGNLWFVDEPQFELGRDFPAVFTCGTIVWDIPIGWNEIGTGKLRECAGQIPSDNIKQVMAIDSNGTITLSKFGQWTSRTTNDWRVVNGVTVKRGAE